MGNVINMIGGGKSTGQYVWSKKISSTSEVIEYVISNFRNSYPVNGMQDGFYYERMLPPFNPSEISWANGTDAQIAEMVAAAEAGEINLSDYWSSGDARKVNLSPMNATYVGEEHVAQEVTFVLMSSACEGFTLAEPTSGGKTTPNFIVGLKNALAEKGYMNKTATNKSGWKDSDRRYWCNEVFRQAIPESFRRIFKPFKWKQGKGQSSTGLLETTDYFGLPPEKVVYGSKADSSYSDEAALYAKWYWYYTESNRIKKLGDTGEDTGWWLCSPKARVAKDFVWVNASGTQTFSEADSLFGISPFGCI